ncbi:hydrolase TatD [Anaerococcus sp. HMSC065G05]|uniref:Qat anti-phage system TatD family nuclease QatD n=1 Tax=Anaerococcus sp. HMSC065G05 TaxID=1739356 RepID=UPI0008A40514|nr:Qat anti-phage system TatD family nuclease QatD [Anaerococcus sp. HMSC065G05]OFJ68017.1 hydrolase TatD [Anaerococcus sp. HMSC065G05]
MTDFYMDMHMHFDLYKNKYEVLKYIEDKKSYTIAVTNLPDLYKKYYAENWNYKYIRLALGFHPELAAQYNDQIRTFKKFFQTTSYIGEVGLDYSVKNIRNIEKQKEVFKQIIDLCKSDKKKIISVHTRKAERDCLKILDGFEGRVILHWYTGNLRDLKIAISRGYFFSINQQMIKSQNGKNIINMIPIDRIVIESDAPFTDGLHTTYNISFMNDIIEYLHISKELDKQFIYAKLQENFRKILL